MKHIFLAVNFFAVLIYTEKEKNLETIVPMPSSSAFERSNSPDIESIMEPFASKNQKQIPRMLKKWEENPEKSAEVTELKAKFMYLCVCEREEKVNSFEITVMIFNVCKK